MPERRRDAAGDDREHPRPGLSEPRARRRRRRLDRRHRRAPARVRGHPLDLRARPRPCRRAQQGDRDGLRRRDRRAQRRRRLRARRAARGRRGAARRTGRHVAHRALPHHRRAGEGDPALGDRVQELAAATLLAPPVPDAQLHLGAGHLLPQARRSPRRAGSTCATASRSTTTCSCGSPRRHEPLVLDRYLASFRMAEGSLSMSGFKTQFREHAEQARRHGDGHRGAVALNQTSARGSSASTR